MNSSLNFAQKTNFICGCPQIPGLEFYLQDVSLPGVSVELAEAKTFALSKYLAGTAHSYGTLSFTVLIDEDFEIYDMFFKNIVDSKSLINGTYAQIEYDLYIQVFNNKGRPLFTEFFKGCVLQSIGDVSLSSTDNSVTNTFTAEFKFDWLEIEKDGLSEEKRKEWNVYPKLKPKCCECCDEEHKTENNP